MFLYMFSTLNVMGHGSHIRWVNGSWVNSSDPLPALVTSNTSECSDSAKVVGESLQCQRSFSLQLTLSYNCRSAKLLSTFKRNSKTELFDIAYSKHEHSA